SSSSTRTGEGPLMRGAWFAIALLRGLGVTFSAGGFGPSIAAAGEVAADRGAAEGEPGGWASLRVATYDRVVDPGIAVPRRGPGIGPRKEPGPGGETLRRALRGHQPPPSTCHAIPPAVFVGPEQHLP